MAFLQLHFQSLLLIIILAHLTFELVHGQHHQELPKFVNGGRRHYIVHMDSSSKPQPFTSHHSWYSSLLSTSTSSSSNAFLNDGGGGEAISSSTSGDLSSPELVYTYENSMKGFTALLSDDHLRQLKLHPAFISAFPDSFGTLETTHSYKFLGLDEVSGVWPESKFGEDVIIGVVDTGVWPESKSFRDDGMPDVPKRWRGRCESGQAFNVSNCNRKLIGARFFNKGIFAENPNSTISMNSARDTDGHGTHTASTAAGSFVSGASYFNYARGTARGMAPRARLAIYKVFWDSGVTTSDTIAAIDQAIADGVDVISLSMSFRRVPLHEDGIAIGSFAAMEKGIFVAAAAGNRGPSHRTVRNGIPWILTVAASNIDRKYSGIVTLGNGVTLTGSSLYIGNMSFLSKTNKIPLYYNLSNADCNSGIDPKENNVTKKVVVCEITDDASSIIGESGLATTIGAAGALLLTRDTLYTEKNKKYEIPAAVLDPKESDIVRKYLNTSKNPTIIFKFGRTIIRTKPAPTLAVYSSRGPSFGSPTVLKPDLMAPGSMILAAYPSNVSVVKVRGKELFSHFNLLYGTSMATPHASGVASLLKSVHPEWSPAAIRSAMMTTADTLDNTGQRIKDGAFTTSEATGLRMGSGHINPIKAMDPGLVYDANRGDYVKFLCGLNYTREEFMTVARNSTEYGICNYTGSEELFNLNYPSFIAFYNNEQTTGVHKFKRTLTNVAEGGFVYTAGLTSMKGFKVSVRPTRLVFRKKGDKVPFVLTLEIVKPMKTDLVEGSLTWVDAKGKHIVRSPIVATTTREVED